MHDHDRRQRRFVAALGGAVDVEPQRPPIHLGVDHVARFFQRCLLPKTKEVAPKRKLNSFAPRDAPCLDRWNRRQHHRCQSRKHGKRRDETAAGPQRERREEHAHQRKPADPDAELRRSDRQHK
ncbi:MAG: hypothetical protein AVDCRST_MAG26-4637 [uncultured Chloroflexia bacterium]|uniref:Uncharacterized protein n=1 Tax=uncultured Chloroflexia bacterium TaxID=1672391 RepID=A0A6J4K8J5_9CHLR|nr:MAG: hypothetical protein AVDCRST_MAG26-4637 [uncultured Chloroflexia bacterium]